MRGALVVTIDQIQPGNRSLLMASSSTIDQLRDIMQDVFDRDDLQIERSTTAEDVEEWDSLSHVRMMVAVERRLKVKFRSSEIEKLKNVGELVDLIDAKR